MVRHIPLTELCVPEHIPKFWDDRTPEWFAFGTFAFSPEPDADSQDAVDQFGDREGYGAVRLCLN